MLDDALPGQMHITIGELRDQVSKKVKIKNQIKFEDLQPHKTLAPKESIILFVFSRETIKNYAQNGR